MFWRNKAQWLSVRYRGLLSAVFCASLLFVFLLQRFSQQSWAQLAGASQSQPARSAYRQTISPPPQRYHYQENFATTQNKYLAENIDWNPGQQSLRLALRDQIQQQETVIGSAPTNEAVYVVWRDLRNDAGDIYAQRIDAQGHPLWATDLRINHDPGLATQFEPAIAVDPAGNLWVAWVDNRQGNNDIYAQYISSAGVHLWNDDKIVNRDPNKADQGGVSLAVLPDQGAVLAWHDNRAGSYDIYVDRLTNEGTPVWAESLRLNSDLTDSAQTYPTIAAATGDFTVAWLDQRVGNSDIYAQRIAASGQLVWNAEVQVNQPADAAQSHPRLAINGAGERWIGWVAAQDGRVLVQQIAANGQVGSAPAFRLSQGHEPADANQQPALVAAANGTFVLAWVASSDRRLYAQSFNSQLDLLWPQAMLLHRPSSDQQVDRQSVALTSARQHLIIATWSEQRPNRPGDVYSQALDQAGKWQWPQERLVNELLGKVDQQLAAVTTTADGEAVVAWQDWRHDTPALFLQRLAATGEPLWSAHLPASSVLSATGQLAPVVATAGTDTFIVWSDNRSGVARLYAQRFDKQSNRQWLADQPINHPADPALAQLNPALTADRQGRLYLVWEEISGSQRRLLLQQLDSQGRPVWSKPSLVPTGATPLLPDLVAGLENDLYLAWIEKSADGANVFVQHATADGAFLWPSKQSANRTLDEVNTLNPPAIGVDDSGNVVVAWVSRGEAMITAQRLSASGQPLWAADVSLNTSGGGFAPLPDLAVLPTGQAIVVWQQIFDKRYTIAAQQLDTAGNPQWYDPATPANAIIVSRQTVGAQRPKIASDAAGNTIVTWQERRFNHWDTVAQRLAPTGELTWAVDRPLVAEERFYSPSGTVESTVVDQTQGEIGSALLTVNYQRNGGAIALWLSNDGGTTWESSQPGLPHRFASKGADLRWKLQLYADPHNAAQTPVVTELVIEYDLAAPAATDPYEEDNACAQARPLQLNGPAQQHTLAPTMPAAEDWLRLAVDQAAPVTVLAQSQPVTSTLHLTIYHLCDGPPIAATATGADGVARLTFSGTAQSHVFVQISPGTGLTASGYALAAYRGPTSQRAVIVAGAAATNNLVTEQIYQVADRAYRTLRHHGYSAEMIDLLSNAPARDADRDGRNDVDQPLSAAGLKAALEAWPLTLPADPPATLLLFLVGSGQGGSFQTQPNEQVTVEQLALWLANSEAKSGVDHIAVLLDLNQAGSWITSTLVNQATNSLAVDANSTATLSGQNRTILTATDHNGAAWHTPTGVLFSDLVWTALDQGASLWESSTQAQTLVAQIGYRCETLTTFCQQPWLDDNGDQRANQPADGALAQTWRLPPAASALTPVIQSVTVQWQAAEQTYVIEATLLRTASQTVVEAEILPPTATVALPTDGLPPVHNFPVVRLQPVTAAQSGQTQAQLARYRGLYSALDKPGDYKVVVFAQTDGELAALPAITRFRSGEIIYLPLIARQ